jgi:hypothetical protein
MSDTTNDQLMPCPFCGTPAKWFKTGRDIGIECGEESDCPGNAQTDTYAPEHREACVRTWNRRAATAPAQPVDERKALIIDQVVAAFDKYRSGIRDFESGRVTVAAQEFDKAIGNLRAALASNEAAPQDFKEWLDSKRDANVSEVFHDIVAQVAKMQSSSPAPQEPIDPLSELKGRHLTLNARQLRAALDYGAPDFETDEDQRDTEICLQWLPERMSVDGEKMEAGLYMWDAEYPEEGVVLLDENYEAAPASAAPAANEAHLRQMEQKATAFDEWIEKTNWVQEQIGTFPVKALGKHHADVMRDEIERLRAIVSGAPLKRLQDLINTQCSDGNWNYDPYMHGLANGLLLAKSCFTDEEPKFLSSPEKWIGNKTSSTSNTDTAREE